MKDARFLKFVTVNLEESEDDFQDELVRQFQETICRIKTDRQMGERYMIFEEMLKEEKQEDITKLKILHKKAARAESIAAFEKETEDYFNSEK